MRMATLQSCPPLQHTQSAKRQHKHCKQYGKNVTEHVVSVLCRCNCLQVSQLGAGVRQARAQSSLELLGRKTLHDGEAAELVSPADPAARILEALLAQPDQATRHAMLPDAFAPPEPQQAAQVNETALISCRTTFSACYLPHEMLQDLNSVMMCCRSTSMKRLSSCTLRQRAWCR